MDNNKKHIYLDHVFHVDLTDKFEGEDYWLQVAGRKYPLETHTEETLAAALSNAPELKAMEGGAITHFVKDVPVRLGTVTRISIRHSNKTGKIPGETGISHVAIHIVHDHEENRRLATEGGTIYTQSILDNLSTAQSLIFHHGDLVTTSTDTASIVIEHLQQDTAPANYALINQLAIQMRKAGPPTQTTGWANYQDYDAGASGTKQTLVPTDATNAAANAPLAAVLNSTKNDVRLQGTSWTLQPGTSVQPNDPPPVTIDTNGQGDNWRASLSNTTPAYGLQSTVTVTDSDKRQVQIDMTNTYVRWLTVYAQFIDANGNAMSTPGWQADDSGVAGDVADTLDLNYDDMRCIGWISPINTIMGMPVSSMPGTLSVKITFPPGAVSVNIYGCGLGTGNNQYPKTPVIGGVFTGLANLGIPVFFLGLGVGGQTYMPLYTIMKDPAFVKAVAVIGVAYFGGSFIYSGAVNKTMDWRTFSALTQLLFTQAANKAFLWCEEQVVEGEMEDEIPFAGWIMLTINIATTLAQIAQTIVEVATSPWMIPNSISTTIDSVLTVCPDPRHNAFPQPPAGSRVTYVTKMIYKDQNRPVLALSVPLDPANYPKTLSATFNNTLGGQVRFEVDFYIDNWLAGKATTEWLPNDEPDTAAVTLYLFQLPIPLDSRSIYKHTAILGYQNNAYTWISQTTPPNATITNADNSQSGNAISIWAGLALSQRHGMLGTAWKAAGMGITDCASHTGGQLYGFETICIPGETMTPKLPTCGLSAASQLVFDVYPAKFLMKDGNFVIENNKPVPDPNDISLGNYYLDSRKADNRPDIDGGYHLRSVTLDATTPFDMNPDRRSFGRFPYYPDSLTLHPSGHAIGVNSQYCKIMITHLALGNGFDDSDIPYARAFAGQALDFNGSNGRAGLLFTPVAITCGYDGTILVLEQLKSAQYNIARIQAFDLNGNPVFCFTGDDDKPSPFLMLPGNVTYLDIAAVGDDYTTYLYVLYYTNSGASTNDYNMSLYQYGQTAPKGNLLVTTPNVPAAKINVDMWHTMYTLNYQMTQDGKGNNAGPAGGSGVGPAGITAPSVSEWLPPLSQA